MFTWRTRAIAPAVAMLVAAALVAGCGGDDTAGPAPATERTTATSGTATTSATATGIPPELAGAVDAFVAALADRDRDRLRDGTGDELRQRLRDRDLDRLRDCVPAGATVEVVSREATVEGDEAHVRVRLRITDATGATSEVEREWELERRADGTWVLTELPSCPFDAAATTTTGAGTTTGG